MPEDWADAFNDNANFTIVAIINLHCLLKALII